jgi:putative endonuclease
LAVSVGGHSARDDNDVILSEAKDLGIIEPQRAFVSDFCVYILANQSRMLYVGVTNDLERRMSEHKQKLLPGYASRYNIRRLVYHEWTDDPESAITREKQIKGWRRARKVALIESANSEWRDLSEDWRGQDPIRQAQGRPSLRSG